MSGVLRTSFNLSSTQERSVSRIINTSLAAILDLITNEDPAASKAPLNQRRTYSVQKERRLSSITGTTAAKRRGSVSNISYKRGSAVRLGKGVKPFALD